MIRVRAGRAQGREFASRSTSRWQWTVTTTCFVIAWLLTGAAVLLGSASRDHASGMCLCGDGALLVIAGLGGLTDLDSLRRVDRIKSDGQLRVFAWALTGMRVGFVGSGLALLLHA